MAANSLTNIMPKILARGLLALREAAIMPRLVNIDYGNEARQKGTTVDIPLPQAQTASDVTPAPTPSSAASNTHQIVQLPLDQWKHTDFHLTDKEQAEIDANEHFIPMQQSEAVRALANSMDNHIHAQYTGIYGYVGTAAVTPFSTVATAPLARKTLSEQLAPIQDRRIVMDPDAEAQALQLAAYSDISQSDDRAVKIEGELGRKFGFDHFMSQNVGSHTAGTQASSMVASTTAAGASSLDVLNSAGTAGTLLLGDIFTIAGDTQTYVVQACATTASAAVALSIDPPLAQIASAAALITTKATHVVNLAFQRNAFAFATRPLMNTASNRLIMGATDPVTGLSLRLELISQFKQEAWDFDVLYGAKLVRPELAARIAG